jgi:L-alanine-DL-glutamate epimerase-like enolase superfamily enzyme
MKITAIRTTPFAIPLARPITFARGAMTHTNHVLVEVETDEGVTGYAEAPSRPYVYGESQRSIIAAIEEWFAPALVGTDPFAIGALWPILDRVEHNNTAKGAIDIALHDIAGKALGISCARLLGQAVDAVSVTYVCGYSSPDEMAAEAAAVYDKHGIASFKLKVGVNPAADEQTLAAMRKALPHALIYVDANEAFDQRAALDFLSMCRNYDVAWVEEPCRRSDRVGRRIVGEHGAVSILGDDSCRTVQEVAHQIVDGSVHIVSIKVARTGYVGSRDIVGLCAAHDLRPMVGSQGDSSIGVLAGAQFCAAFTATAALPAELSFHLNLADGITYEAPVISDGKLRLPKAPGLGFEIDPAKLKRFASH